MGIHYTTAVLPAQRTGQDTDNAVLIFAADTAEDIDNLPLPVALHAVGNELTCFAPHARMIGGPLPVSDAWLRAAAPTGAYTAQAKVCLVLEPLPEEAGTSHVPAAEGVTEEDLPSWVADVIDGRYKMALRPVHLSTGPLALVDTALQAPTTLSAWAEYQITP